MVSRRTRWCGFVAAVAALLQVAGCKPDNAPLPKLGADLPATSVSGLSAGAYMAGQFHIAHSHIIVGAGIVAGGPYGCAESVFADVMPGPGTAFLNLSKAVNGCMLDAMQSWGVPNTNLLAERARKLAQANRIDAVAGLARNRVYLFTGTHDQVVVPSIVKAAAKLYAELGVPEAQIKLVANIPAGHAFITEDKGLACGRTAEPYIADCDYDQAGDLLAHIYGRLQPRTAEPAGTFLVFNQREFTHDLTDHGLDDAGVVYIPPGCWSSPGCRVHIAFHGCKQQRAKIGDTFIKDSGFIRWADANRLIVLFPQIKPNTVNPQACWDWWGYTGRNYLTRQGPQIAAVRRMLDRLTAKP